jgi:pyridoxine kinase
VVRKYLVAGQGGSPIARVLAISSQVVRGHIGLSAIVPALQRLGHEVWPLPTVLLSNHPGHSQFAITRIGGEDITRMTDSLAASGWLDEIDAVISGYLPTPSHVEAVGKIVRSLKARRSLTYLCDPVIGDDPKGVYIDLQAAQAIRDELLPLADIATPNRFELSWLKSVSCETLAAVCSAACALGPALTVTTSAEIASGKVTSVLVAAGEISCGGTVHQPTAPHGTGDLFSGLLLGHLLNRATPVQAFEGALAGVAAALEASASRDELDLTGPAVWQAAT